MRWVLLAIALCGCEAPRAEPRVLRVCADPNNLPFSNKAEQGFENKIARLLADDLHARLEYTWWPQRRGFFKNTLAAKACDVVLGVPKGIDHARTTAAYYRSSFVFVTRTSDGAIASLDDPRLQTLRVGVPVGGDDGANPPPAHALARRGIFENVRGYNLLADYSQSNPPLELLRALDNHDIDVAIVWGPFAGYYALGRDDLAIRRVHEERDVDQPFRFSIAMGVRRADVQLHWELESFLARREGEVNAILDQYGVPR